MYKRIFDVETIPLADSWALRQFVVCFRDLEALQPAARRMVDHLSSRAKAKVA